MQRKFRTNGCPMRCRQALRPVIGARLWCTPRRQKSISIRELRPSTIIKREWMRSIRLPIRIWEDIPMEMQISPFIARKQANSRFLHTMQPGLRSGVTVQLMSAEDLKAPVADLERSSTPAGSRVYILSRARTFISLMQETSSWIFRP